MNLKILLPDYNLLFNLVKNNYDLFLLNWWYTFSVSISSALLALFMSLLLAILSIKFRIIKNILIPTVSLTQSFPLQSIAPLIIIVLGIGFHTKATIAFLIAFFPMYSSILTSLENTPEYIQALLRINDTKFLKGVFYVKIPSIYPSIISSMKIGFTLSVLGAVVSEFIQPDGGLGYLILLSQSSYNIEVIYLCIILLIIQGVSIFSVLSYYENKIIKQRS